jgi:hypothetical protein
LFCPPIARQTDWRVNFAIIASVEQGEDGMQNIEHRMQKTELNVQSAAGRQITQE